MADGGAQWRTEEMSDLIRIWGDTVIQAKLKGCYRNRAVFEEISREMAKRGHRRTWLQCQRKVKSLKAKFKECKELNQRSGRERVFCPFYDELNRILSDRPSCPPTELLDSCDVAVKEEPESTGSEASLTGTNAADSETDDSIYEPESPPSAPYVTEESPSAANTHTSKESNGASFASGCTSAKSRKRKSKLEATLEIFADKIAKSLKSDNEVALKMQAAQHAHELKMLTMLTQFMERTNNFRPPPFNQAPDHPHHNDSTKQPMPQNSSSNFNQPPPVPVALSQSLTFHESSSQPHSFMQDRAPPPPLSRAPALSPNTHQSDNQMPAHCQVLVHHTPFNQTSSNPRSYQPSDVDQTVIKEDREERSPDVDLQDHKPVLVKEEEEEAWTSVEEEHLNQKETDASRLSVTAVSLKSLTASSAANGGLEALNQQLN